MSEGVLFQSFGHSQGPLHSGRHWGPMFGAPWQSQQDPVLGFSFPLLPPGPHSWPARVKPKTSDKLAVSSLTASLWKSLIPLSLLTLKKGNCHPPYIVNKCYPLLPGSFHFSVITSFDPPKNHVVDMINDQPHFRDEETEA